VVDFLIYSPPKTGTTGLCHMLIQSPKIKADINRVFEIFFFNKETIEDEDLIKYNNLFEYSEGSLLFEKSPPYFSIPIAIENIKKNCKENLKFIVIIRNPVDRFISEYTHFRSIKNILNKDTSYMDELSKRENWEKIWNSAKGESYFLNFHHINEIFDKNFSSNSSMKIGCYNIHLDRLYSYIKSENVHLIKYENFKKDSALEINKICDFLKIPFFKFNQININTSNFWIDNSIKSQCEDVSKEINNVHKKYLYEYYYEPNKKLDEMFPEMKFNYNELA